VTTDYPLRLSRSVNILFLSSSSFFLFPPTVLPPVPTTGLTGANVTELATGVREQMLAALRDISVKTGSTRSKHESGDRPPPKTTVLEGPAGSATIEESEPPHSAADSEEMVISAGDGMSVSEGSDSSRKKDSSEAGTETEEEEGMVLVGRPT